MNLAETCLKSRKGDASQYDTHNDVWYLEHGWKLDILSQTYNVEEVLDLPTCARRAHKE